jgi:hypothetical protein
VAIGDLRPSAMESDNSDVLACYIVKCVTEYLSGVSDSPATAMFMLLYFYCDSEMSRVIRRVTVCLSATL